MNERISFPRPSSKSFYAALFAMALLLAGSPVAAQAPAGAVDSSHQGSHHGDDDMNGPDGDGQGGNHQGPGDHDGPDGDDQGPHGPGHHPGQPEDHCDDGSFQGGEHPCDPFGPDDDDTTSWIRFEHRGERAVEGQKAVLEVERHGLLGVAVSVEYRTVDGTALVEEDYVSTSGVLEWAAGDGSSRSIVIDVVEDDLLEGYEYFEVELLAPIGGEIDWHHGEAHVTVFDGDEPVFAAEEGLMGFHRRSYQASERDGMAIVEVARRHGVQGQASVQYLTRAVSASEGFDYEDVAGTLFWGDGEGGIQSFEVPVFDDDDVEGNETVELLLENAEGAALDPARSTELLELLDDDGDTSTCQIDADTLCLLGGRFRVEVSWADFEGRTGRGHGQMQGDQSGLFWFFREDNKEMLVKMVDGCALSENPRFWVFVAATTSVDYTLTVTDTVTGLTRQYGNPLGRTAEPIEDTFTFDVCSAP
jgi:hypothetical protein